MKLLESELDKLAATITEMESKREILGSAISSIKDTLKFPNEDPDILEDKFIFQVKPNTLENVKVAGVDGGIVNARYHGASLVVGRAAAIIFDFKGKKLADADYFPSTFPDPEPIAFLDPMTNSVAISSGYLGKCYFELEDYEKAIEYISVDVAYHSKQDNRHPDNLAINYHYLARCHLELGNLRKAKNAIYKALKLNVSSDEIHTRIKKTEKDILRKLKRS